MPVKLQVESELFLLEIKANLHNSSSKTHPIKPTSNWQFQLSLAHVINEEAMFPPKKKATITDTPKLTMLTVAQ